MSRLELPVNSPDWRTGPAKKVLEDDVGEWLIEIQDATDMVIRQIAFQLRCVRAPSNVNACRECGLGIKEPPESIRRFSAERLR